LPQRHRQADHQEAEKQRAGDDVGARDSGGFGTSGGCCGGGGVRILVTALFWQSLIDKTIDLLRTTKVSVSHVTTALIPDTRQFTQLVKIFLLAAHSSVTTGSVGAGVTLSLHTILFSILGTVNDWLHAQTLENLPSVGVTVAHFSIRAVF